MQRPLLPIAAAVVLAALLPARPATAAAPAVPAQVRHVGPHPGEYSTVQAAIDAVRPRSGPVGAGVMRWVPSTMKGC
jgi:pectin methylesterase-like acyl-CoA thioesterase